MVAPPLDSEHVQAYRRKFPRAPYYPDIVVRTFAGNQKLETGIMTGCQVRTT